MAQVFLGAMVNSMSNKGYARRLINTKHPHLMLRFLTHHRGPAYRIVSESAKAPKTVRKTVDLHALSITQGVQNVSELMHIFYGDQ